MDSGTALAIGEVSIFQDGREETGRSDRERATGGRIGIAGLRIRKRSGNFPQGLKAPDIGRALSAGLKVVP
jgi:hypothetical protein